MLKLSVLTLLTLCVGLSQAASRHKRQESTSSNLEINTFQDWVGPRRKVDLIFVLDRSKGMGKERFYLEEKALVKQLIMEYCTLHDWYVHVAGMSAELLTC